MSIWLLPTIAFGVFAVVAAVMICRLAAEFRATSAALVSVAEAADSVRVDLSRARAAIDDLDVPSLRQATTERALGLALRWAARRVVPF